MVWLELERENGDTVQTLPTEQRVDFAGLVDVTEFVTAATTSAATYVAATLRLNNANYVVIPPGVPALLQLDFDLAATPDVDTTLENATQAATTTLPAPRQIHRVSRSKLLKFAP